MRHRFGPLTASELESLIKLRRARRSLPIASLHPLHRRTGRPRRFQCFPNWLCCYEQFPKFNGLVGLQTLNPLSSLVRVRRNRSVAPENPKFDEELREKHVGLGVGGYRAVFTIRGNEVHVLTIRRGAQRELGDQALG